jgi:hypothetical protein
MVTGFFSFYLDSGYGDANLGAYRGMEVQQRMADYLDSIGCNKERISTASYLESQHLVDPETGFLKAGHQFIDVGYEISPATRYVVFDNIEPDDRREQIRKDTAYQLALRYTNSNVWGEIYRRK